jgi:hypothetical protein
MFERIEWSIELIVEEDDFIIRFQLFIADKLTYGCLESAGVQSFILPYDNPVRILGEFSHLGVIYVTIAYYYKLG